MRFFHGYGLFGLVSFGWKAWQGLVLCRVVGIFFVLQLLVVRFPFFSLF